MSHPTASLPDLSFLDTLPVTPIPAIPLPSTPPPITNNPITNNSLSPSPSPSPHRSHLPDTPHHLPDGTPLNYTLAVDAVMHEVFAGENLLLLAPSGAYQTYVFLYLCANTPAPGERPIWDAVALSDDGLMMPLFLRPAHLIRAALDWFEARFSPTETAGFMILALQVWNHHKAAEVLIDPTATSGTLPEKKNPVPATPTPSTSSSTSSPAATPSSAMTSTIASPSA